VPREEKSEGPPNVKAENSRNHARPEEEPHSAPENSWQLDSADSTLSENDLEEEYDGEQPKKRRKGLGLLVEAKSRTTRGRPPGRKMLTQEERRERRCGSHMCTRCPFRVGTAYMLVTLLPTRPFDAVCSLMSNRMAAKRAYYRRLDRTNDMGQVSKPNFCCHQFQRFMKSGCLLSQSCIESNVRHMIGVLSLTTRCSGGVQTQRRAQSSSIKIGYLREPSAAGTFGWCRP
jgi:hypothetical protein